MILEDLIVTVLGGALVLSGFAIRFWIGKRRFERRGLGGLQHYSSYSKSLIVSAIERIGNLLSIPMILGGIFLLVFWWMYVRDITVSRNNKDRENKTEYKSDPTAHFLVPAEESFREKMICPIPIDTFPLSMNRLV